MASLACATILGLLLLVSGCGSAKTPAAATNTSVSAAGTTEVATSGPSAAPRIPHTDVNPFGVNTFLEREVEDWKKEQTMRMIHDAGIGWIKQQFVWAEIEEGGKGVFVSPKWHNSTWEKYDRIVDLADQYGIRVIARLDMTPAWARPPDSDAGTPPTNLNDFGDFVAEFVQHYKGRVQYLQIWNEPNLQEEWGRKGVDPKAYVEMLKIAYQRAKEADPNVFILTAPLAITLETGPEHLNETMFLQQMYDAGAKDYFDIVSANAYGMEQPPTAPADPKVLNFARVELLRQVMEKNGDSNKAIWFNEYAWNASPETMPKEALIWQRVTEQQQADYTVAGIDMARQQWPWAGVMNIWYFRQVGDIPPDKSEYYFRMVDPDFTPRLVYDSVKTAAQAMMVAGNGRHEETSAPVTRMGSWVEVAAPNASGTTYYKTDKPGNSLTLTFKGTDLSVVVRKGPDGGVLYVKVDGNGKKATGLPKTDDGTAVLDLYSPQEEWQVPVVVAKGLSASEQHTVELTMADKRNASSSGAAIAVDAFDVSGGK